MRRSPRLTVRRCETCCPEFCSPPESFSEIQGRCALHPQRTTDRPAPRERQRYSRAFQPPPGSCDSKCCPPCSWSAGPHQERGSPDTPLPDRNRLEGRLYNGRSGCPPSSSSRAVPRGEAGLRPSRWPPPREPPASTASCDAPSRSPLPYRPSRTLYASEYAVN